MVLFEKQIGARWIIKELKKAEQRKPGSWQDVWKEVFDVPDEGGKSSNRDLVKSAKTFKQAVQLLEDLLPFYDRLAKVVVLPSKEVDTQYRKLVKEAKAANPLAAYILPAMDKV